MYNIIIIFLPIAIITRGNIIIIPRIKVTGTEIINLTCFIKSNTFVTQLQMLYPLLSVSLAGCLKVWKGLKKHVKKPQRVKK